MICPVCGNDVAAKRNRCERCGEDLTIYRKMYLLSNKYYNEAPGESKGQGLIRCCTGLKKEFRVK